MIRKFLRLVGGIVMLKVILAIIAAIISELQYKQAPEELREDLQKGKKLIADLLLEPPFTKAIQYSHQLSEASSKQIVALEELEQYEKARDAGLQALENYVIQNPNSPYISRAKDLIQNYKGVDSLQRVEENNQH